MRRSLIATLGVALVLAWTGAAFAKKPVEVTGVGEVFQGKGKLLPINVYSLPVVSNSNGENYYCLRVSHSVKKQGWVDGHFSIQYSNTAPDIEIPGFRALGGVPRDGELLECVMSPKTLAENSIVFMETFPRRARNGAVVKMKKKDEYLIGMEIVSRYDPRARGALDFASYQSAQAAVSFDQARMAPAGGAEATKVPSGTPFVEKRFLFVETGGKVPRKFSHALLLGKEMPAPASFCWDVTQDFTKQSSGKSTVTLVVQTPPPNQQQVQSRPIGGKFVDGQVMSCVEWPGDLPSGTLVFVNAKNKGLKGAVGNEFSARLLVLPESISTEAASTAAVGWTTVSGR